MTEPVRNILAFNAAVVTPGATVFAPSWITVYGAGNVTVTTEGGQSLTFTGVPAGHTLPVMCKAVTAATATNIIRTW